MSEHDETIVMRQMLDHAREAILLTKKKTYKDLVDDRTLQLALTRLIEVIGEAAARLPKTIRERYPYIPWKEIVATRNTLIHDYDEIDLEILWQTLRQDIPSFAIDLEQILKE